MSPELPWSLVDAGLRGMVFGWVLLLAAQLARQPRPYAALTLAGLLLCLGLAVQVPGSSPWAEHRLSCAWQTPLVAIAVGNAVLFWLFTAALFDDDFRWRPWHAMAWALAALIGSAQCLAVTGLEPGPALTALRILLRMVTLVCVLAAIWVALRHWRADLVESRRRLRLLLVVAGIVYSAVQLSARLGSPTGQLTPGLALLDIALLLLVIAAWAATALQLRLDGLVGAGPPRTEAAPSLPLAEARPQAKDEPSAADDALASALRQAMEGDRAYRDDGLTLASLAERLAVPEYRLRRHINRQLGFRNFNVFVNSFRLADARRWLADPELDAPVLTIAMDAGFGSIGPFNRAFKADTGLTPTEFRARALAESGKG